MTETADDPGNLPAIEEHDTGTSGEGLRLRYLRCRPAASGGGGKLIILLHGWPETGRAWRKVMPLLARGGFDVVAPDLRGLGASARPREGYDKKSVAADVRALARVLGHGRVTCLVGHDIGAMVAFAGALRWPDEIERVVLCEALLPGHGLEAMYRATEPGRFPFMAFHMTPDLPEALVAGREAVYLGWFYDNLAHDPATIDRGDVAANAVAYAQPGALRAGFEHYRAFPRDAEDNKALLAACGGQVPVPVLAVGGASGVGDGLARSLQPIAPRLRGVVIQECGHWIAAEQPRRLADEILAFCGENGAPATP